MMKRFWVETTLAWAAALLAAVTAFRPMWIEQLFGFDPDQHSSAFEWGLVASLGLAAALIGAHATHTWRLARRADVR